MDVYCMRKQRDFGVDISLLNSKTTIYTIVYIAII